MRRRDALRRMDEDIRRRMRIAMDNARAIAEVSHKRLCDEEQKAERAAKLAAINTAHKAEIEAHRHETWRQRQMRGRSEWLRNLAKDGRVSDDKVLKEKLSWTITRLTDHIEKHLYGGTKSDHWVVRRMIWRNELFRRYFEIPGTERWDFEDSCALM